MPPHLGSQKLWLEADVELGTYGNGDAIALWHDQSGLANDAFSDTADPGYFLNVLNGYPVVRFNGTSTGLALASVLSLASFSIYAVLKTTAADQMLMSRTGDNRQLRLNYAGTAGKMSMFDGVNDLRSPSGLWPTGAFHIARWFGGGLKGKIYVDEVEAASYEPSDTFGITMALDLIGNFGEGSNFLDGDVAALLAYDTDQHGTADDTTTYDYLYNKYFVTSNVRMQPMGVFGP